MRRSSYDREILRLAVPALFALAAEPLYLLVDTAIVGHIGTRELAALALAATVLGGVTALCNFLTYGTTAQVARLHGAGQLDRAGALAAQALWLAAAVGIAAAAACALLAGPIMHALGGAGETADLAARYLRLSSIGLPFALVSLAGIGWMRGMDDLRTPLVYVVAGNVVNAVLQVVLVYGFGRGLDASALSTVVAQAGMGTAFVRSLLAAPAASRRPDRAILRRLSRMGGHIVVRTGSLLASFTVASAVLARVGEPELAAHQIAFQLFVFLALVLDAIAIAGQVLVGRMLGSGDREGAFAAAGRMCVLSFIAGCGLAVVLLATTEAVPALFTADEQVQARAHDLWPFFALMQPVGALVFALDGILIGAGDTRYLAYAMAISSAVFIPLVIAAGTLSGVWVALNVLMLMRLISIGPRFLGRRWAVTGAPA